MFVFVFLVLKKSSGAFNHSFIWIVFKLTTSLRFLKETCSGGGIN